MEASGRPSVALVALLRLVFVSGLLNYSYIPKGNKLELTLVMKPRGSENIRATEQEVVCERDVITGSESFPGKDPVSQLFIHCPLFVSQLSLRQILDDVWMQLCMLLGAGFGR